MERPADKLPHAQIEMHNLGSPRSSWPAFRSQRTTCLAKFEGCDGRKVGKRKEKQKSDAERRVPREFCQMSWRVKLPGGERDGRSRRARRMNISGC